jgi:hypothetical protein
MRKRDGHFVNFCTLTPFSKHPVEKIVRAPKDYDPDLGA